MQSLTNILACSGVSMLPCSHTVWFLSSVTTPVAKKICNFIIICKYRTNETYLSLFSHYLWISKSEPNENHSRTEQTDHWSYLINLALCFFFSSTLTPLMRWDHEIWDHTCFINFKFEHYKLTKQQWILLFPTLSNLTGLAMFSLWTKQSKMILCS